MASVALRNDTLIEIATFLVRRWSENDKIVVSTSKNKVNETRIKENKVILIPVSDYNGDEFSQYRQFRTATWYESMKIKNCDKIYRFSQGKVVEEGNYDKFKTTN